MSEPGYLSKLIVDRDHPEKTRARVMAIMLGLIPLLMAGVLFWWR